MLIIEGCGSISTRRHSIQNQNEHTQETVEKPVLVDDFFRNWLIKMGMKRSLDAFQVG